MSLSGDLDIYALPAVERDLAALTGARVVIDLSEVRLVSAAFFGALVRLRRRLPESSIEVVGAREDVRRIFRLVAAESFVTLA